MVFNSYIFFLIFLPVFLAGFFLLRGKSWVLCKWWIVAASIVFFAPFGIRNVAVLFSSVVFNAVMARAISQKRGGKILLVSALFVNLAVLLIFKFQGHFFPIAISFYTFNQISFLVDLYRGEVGSFELLDYLCYILFFPKLLQGPLMGYEDFEKELGKTSGLDFERMLRGLYLFSMGLFKKVILADTFGKAADHGFTDIASLGSLEAVLVAVFYTFQLYFDFGGYCDMAAGICMIMGFELPLNFDSPYKATSIVDFWKRWHITLTRFFTKYVYIPLGGNRKGEGRMYLNFMIVFLLSGLWHGNGWNFIIWGAMHGVLYVLTRFVMRHFGKKSDGREAVNGGAASDGSAKTETITGRLLHAVKVLLTFAYVTLAWVFFRAQTAGDAIMLIGKMFTGGRKAIATQLSSCFRLDELWYVIKVTPIMKLSFAWESCLWLFVIVASVMIFFMPNAIATAKKCRIGIGTTLLTAVLLVWSILSFAGVSTFLYMNF